MPPGWGEVGIQSDIILQVYENRLQRTLKRQTNSGNEAHQLEKDYEAVQGGAGLGADRAMEEIRYIREFNTE